MKIVVIFFFLISCLSLTAQKVVKYELDSLEKLDRITAMLNGLKNEKTALSSQIQAELSGGAYKRPAPTFAFNGINGLSKFRS
jgi:hypothetical protein